MTERFVLQDFPVTVPFEQVCASLRLEDEDDIAMMQGKFAAAKRIACPKAVYRICAVDNIVDERVCIEGKVFESAMLARNLDGIHRVFAYVVTCGREVDDWSHRETDPIVGVWLDMIKEMLLSDARRQFWEHICKAHKISSLSSMSPGSGNLDTWPICQQQMLFDLIGDVPAATGAVLTDSFLMLPTKTVSGVLYHTDQTFVTCSVCRRINCIGRKAPYTGESREDLPVV